MHMQGIYLTDCAYVCLYCITVCKLFAIRSQSLCYTTDIKLLKYRILTSISLLVHMAAVLLRNTVNFTSLCACGLKVITTNEPSAKRTNEYKYSLNIITFGLKHKRSLKWCPTLEAVLTLHLFISYFHCNIRRDVQIIVPETEAEGRKHQ